MPFAVNAVTGVVTVNGPLDFETQQSYQFLVHSMIIRIPASALYLKEPLHLQIEARETSTSQQLFSTAVINIIIDNENDNVPFFAQTEYRFQVPENSAPRALTSTTPAGLSAITVRNFFHPTLPPSCPSLLVSVMSTLKLLV